MASCVECGREFPGQVAGEASDKCVECRVRERIEQEKQVKYRRPPLSAMARMFPVSSALVAINLLVYAGCAIQSVTTGRGSPINFEAGMLLPWGANFGPLTLDGQFWRIFTCMFVHGGLIHVAANMWCFWDFGRIAERIYGHWRMLALYLLTGLASSVASLAIHPTTISVGASGAIFGIVGTLVFPFYRRRLVLPGPVMKSMMRSLLAFIGINLLIGSAVPIIDNAAHVGGLVAGLVLGAVVTQLATSGVELGQIFPKVAAVAAVLIGASLAGVKSLHRVTILPTQALMALDKGDVKTAQQRAQEALVQNPRSLIAHVAMGEVYRRKNQFADSAREFRAAYEMDPKDADLAGQLGAAYVATGNWKEAEPALRQAVKGNPDDAISLLNLGITVAAQGRADEGIGYLKEAIKQEPNSPKAQYALGSLLMDQHKYQEAIGPLRQAVRLDPNNADYKKTLDQVSAQMTSGS